MKRTDRHLIVCNVDKFFEKNLFKTAEQKMRSMFHNYSNNLLKDVALSNEWMDEKEFVNISVTE